ncbi:MAG: DUF3795 domain-containing protein [Chlorobiales bacterium]|nr:DUF3795 domain-containing protein [Chlorobiales bacterium]
MAQKRKKILGAIRPDLIAPCGMNCRLCYAYVRNKNSCPGCRADDNLKPKTRVICKIKTCEKLLTGGFKYCFSCDDFPCQSITHMDKRYRTKYQMSTIENLNRIREVGVRRFVREENEKWTCPECSEFICVHKPECLSCGHQWR